MIKIERTDVYGWEAAIRGMRNPMNSWEKSDSTFLPVFAQPADYIPEIGSDDLSLMRKLVNAGSDHSKFMRMITVTTDVTAPLYWWKEYDTYKVGTVANSCSTMHKIHAKAFERDDFSCDRLDEGGIAALDALIVYLEAERRKFVANKEDRQPWHNMIQLLPTSYNQKRTIQLNYAVLRNMYHSRKNHKLDEWHTFCEWVESLPYAELITND